MRGEKVTYREMQSSKETFVPLVTRVAARIDLFKKKIVADWEFIGYNLTIRTLWLFYVDFMYFSNTLL